jgi:hypothetical protein
MKSKKEDNIGVALLKRSGGLRDRPFNMKGGGYGFLFRSEFFFRTTQELEYLLFLSRKT